MTPRHQLRDVPPSVSARLRNLARVGNVDFNLLLDHYAAERFLIRLSASGEVNRFTLNGAALFRVWTETELRPTRDVDFLATGAADHLIDRLQHIINIRGNSYRMREHQTLAAHSGRRESPTDARLCCFGSILREKQSATLELWRWRLEFG